jgi:hypothetical protein
MHTGPQDQNLIGSGAVGKSAPSVALSADCSSILVGGSNDPTTMEASARLGYSRAAVDA